MVNTETGAKTGKGGLPGVGPQVTWERGGAEEGQPQVRMSNKLALKMFLLLLQFHTNQRGFFS